MSPEPPWNRKSKPVRPLLALPIKPLVLDVDSTMQTDWALNEKEWSFLDSLSLDSVHTVSLLGSTAAWFGLRRFFLQLPQARHKTIEIYHWGDSQIEGDRISGQLRESWQRRWGGHGPGWVMPVTPAPHGHVHGSLSGDVLRRTGFGRRRDTSAMKLPFLAVNHVSERVQWIASASASEGSLMGWTLREIWPLEPPPQREDLNVRTECDTLTFDRGALRGVHLGSRKGVMVHNLPMRGASGTTLNRLPDAEWDWLQSAHPPSMVVLQFGGNAVPGMTRPEQAHWYAQNMGRLVRNLRERFPSSVVVFIGPSDMGLRPEDYPGLPWVIDALALEIPKAGGLFWDMQSAMGGPGSMAEWHAKGWAGADHIHFSRAGAREAARRLERALWLSWRDMCNPKSPSHD